MKKIILFVCFLVLTTVGTDAQTGQPDSNPALLSPAKYTMPQSAVDAGIGGKVVVGIRIDQSGTPTKAALITGPAWPCGTIPVKAIEELASTLESTMMKLQFSPAMKGGKPVSEEVGLPLELKNPKLETGPEVDPATGKPRAKVISGGVINGRAKSLPAPSYPAEARANRDSGSVVIQVMIDENGNVLRAGAISGAATLQFAAREAACRAKFSPTTLQGMPVKVSGVITYNFNIR